MDLNKIYNVINEVLDSYIVAGVSKEDLLSFLNNAEENYDFIFNKVYRKLTLENVQFESEELKTCLKDSVRDKIAIINDLEV